MAALTCDICGGSLSMDASGDFAVCESCGMKHTKDRVKAKIQGIGGSSVKPAQTVASNVSKVIPKRFTDKFINDEKTELDKSIEECKLHIKNLDKVEKINADIEEELRNDIQKRQNELSEINRNSGLAESFRVGEDGMIKGYMKRQYDAATGKYEARKSKESEIRKKDGYEIKQRELEVLLRKTEVQRTEEHYQSLIAEKNTANNKDKLAELAKKFRDMEGYADTAELANECENQAVEVQYNKLVQAKNNASTEKTYQDLAKQFRAMNGYEDTDELARECDNRYSELKEQRVEVEYNELVEAMIPASTEQEYLDLAKQFQAMNDYKNTSELANECNKRYRELKQRAEQERIEREHRAEQERKEKEEQERIKREQDKKELERYEHEHLKEEKKKRLFWTIFSIVVGGIVGGLLFAFLAKNVDDSWIGPLGGWGGIIAGILFFGISAFHKDEVAEVLKWGCGGCLGGCIVGAIIAMVVVNLLPVASIAIGVVAGAGAGYGIRRLKE
jgi:hypothetical protein